MQIGARIGAYEVIAKLGEGGMGEVYRARDTKLNREVAVKILPALPSSGAAPATSGRDERRIRFQREAELLASLNHPSIAAIYGLEDSTPTLALVLELVEGPTLADRIADRPLSLDESLTIAHQIADALDAAHDRGIIHRDLKPANIKVRPDGTVKVLDFGLAKLLDPEGAALRSGNVSLSPTLSVHATVAGVILGTAAYMSPEQARGRPVDRRADIWAFGCVLVEMLSGKRPFDGDDVAEIIGAVIHNQPAWNRLPATTPPHVRTVIERCLEKDIKNRVRDIGDVKLALGGAFHSTRTDAPAAAPARDTWSAARLAAIGTILMLAAIAATAALVTTFQRPAPAAVSRFAIVPTGADTITAITADRNVAISPDGLHIVYVGNNGTALYVRAIDRLETSALASPGAPRGPFISPDGQWIGFFDGRLKKVAMSGGPPVEISGIDGQRSGGTWGEDGTIVYATGNQKTGLWRVAAAGGEPQVLTTPNRDAGEQDHVFPEFLPGGRSLLFTIVPTTGSIDEAQVAALDLASGTFKVVLKGGSQASYVATGHLIYGAADSLRAVPFDLATLAVTGAPVPVISQAATTASGAAHFTLSRTGTLVYMPEGADESERTLVWMDRTGRIEPIGAPTRIYRRLRLSPDGTRLALEMAQEGESGLWTWDVARQTLTRLTFDGVATNPVWTPDSRSLLFSAAMGQSTRQLFRQSADGSGSAEPLTDSEQVLPSSVAADGRSVVLVNVQGGAHTDLELLSLDAAGTRQRLTQTPMDERNAEISPDGRWIAYEAGTQGASEIFVRPFPDLSTGQWQISTEGGRMPIWSRDGRELFYVTRVGGRDQSSNPATLMRVSVDAGRTWSSGRPEPLFEAPFLGDPGNSGRTYDIAPDGRRFVLIRPPRDADAAANARRLVVVQNWFAELAAVK
jgi:Tol biopolymer transport system component